MFQAAVTKPLDDFVANLTKAVSAWSQETEHLSTPLHESVREVLRMMSEIAPLLGLVLFGDEEEAVRFYNEDFYPVIERTLEPFQQEISQFPGASNRIAAIASLGMFLGLALDRRLRIPCPGEEEAEETVTDVATDLLLAWLLESRPILTSDPVRRPPRTSQGELGRRGGARADSGEAI